MAKYHGRIGFATFVETAPGVWTEVVQPRVYAGEVNHIVHRWESSENVNDDFNVNNEISIIADIFAMENLSHIRWVEWSGTKWKVSAVQAEYPRLKLSIGGVWNGEEN